MSIHKSRSRGYLFTGQYIHNSLLYHSSRVKWKEELRPLYNDSEVLAQLKRECVTDSLPSALEIAERYVYPQKYVKEILLPLLI